MYMIQDTKYILKNLLKYVSKVLQSVPIYEYISFVPSKDSWYKFFFKLHKYNMTSCPDPVSPGVNAIISVDVISFERLNHSN